jgi:hypothetical protein
MRKEGERLIIEPARPKSLLALLATLEPLDEEFLADARTRSRSRRALIRYIRAVSRCRRERIAVRDAARDWLRDPEFRAEYEALEAHAYPPAVSQPLGPGRQRANSFHSLPRVQEKRT